MEDYIFEAKSTIIGVITLLVIAPLIGIAIGELLFTFCKKRQIGKMILLFILDIFSIFYIIAYIFKISKIYVDEFNPLFAALILFLMFQFGDIVYNIVTKQNIKDETIGDTTTCICNNCKAKVELNSEEISNKCYYCPDCGKYNNT